MEDAVERGWIRRAVLVGAAVLVLGGCTAGTSGDAGVMPTLQPSRDTVAQIEPRWIYTTSDRPTVSWTLSGSILYLSAVETGVDGGILTAVEAASGDELWSREYPGHSVDLLPDGSDGVILVQPTGGTNTLIAYDDTGAESWVAEFAADPDDVVSGALHDPISVLDVENRLVMIGSRSAAGVFGVDLDSGEVRWHLTNSASDGSSLFAGNQLERFDDMLVAVDYQTSRTIAVLDLAEDGSEPSVRWQRSTRSDHWIFADEHGVVGVSADNVNSWDLESGELLQSVGVGDLWEEQCVLGYCGRSFSYAALFEDVIVIDDDDDARIVIDREDLSVRAFIELDRAGTTGHPLRAALRGSGRGRLEEAPEELLTLSPVGSLAWLTDAGSVTVIDAGLDGFPDPNISWFDDTDDVVIGAGWAHQSDVYLFFGVDRDVVVDAR